MASKSDMLRKANKPRSVRQEGGRDASEIQKELTGLAGVIELDLGQIRIDGGTQIRVSLDQATVAEYAECMFAGDVFPALDVTFDGSEYWLTDGFHRFHALKQTGAKQAACEVTEGTKRDAVLAGIKANSTHGLRRSNADKRKAVETLLSDSEWSKWSAREISKVAGVSDKTVSAIRAELSGAEIPHVVKGADGKEYKATTKKPSKANANKAQKAARDAVRSVAKVTKKATPETAATVATKKDLETAQQAVEWLNQYIEALKNA